jgi:amino acid transporter
MDDIEKPTLWEKLKKIVIGKAHNPYDSSLFHNISLVAFFAWVGLGSDGLSSCCYGPQEAFLALNGHIYLSIFVALGTAITIFVISASYSQIIELFPSGGGGYLVASKLLSPNLGMISGCALLIDYVLTITVSVASGADAIFSFLPATWHVFKLEFAIAILFLLIILNLRGAKESVVPLIPIFLTFVVTHLFAIGYAIFANLPGLPSVMEAARIDVSKAHGEIGLLGMAFVILRAYSMGAGTFTGIEAVSNGMPVLRDPKVKTARRTMHYMSVSLIVTVIGLMFAYLIYRVQLLPGKTLNAVLFEKISLHLGSSGYTFVLITLLSEAILLFVAAQTGFLGGPRVLANMSLDKWFPTRFTMLSDRFVNQNGVIIMGLLAMAMMVLARGSVTFLVVLYSINVFITFTLSQLGMVRHWWNSRRKIKGWKKKILVNGTGLVLTSFILVTMTVIKFHEGGWITLVITGALVVFAVTIKRHYYNTAKLLRRLNDLVLAVGPLEQEAAKNDTPASVKWFNPQARTAVIFVSGFNGLGLHTLFGVIRLFENTFKNFVFVQIGVLDAGNFKGIEEIKQLDTKCSADVGRYVHYMQMQGYNSEGISVIGTDVMDEIEKIAPRILEKYPSVVFFGGQLVFPQETYLSKWLHNYTVFAMQRVFYSKGIPFMLLPIRV